MNENNAVVTIPDKHFQESYEEFYTLICGGEGYKKVFLHTPIEETNDGKKILHFEGDPLIIIQIIKLADNLARTWH